MADKQRHGSSQGRKPGGKVEPKLEQSNAKKPKGPRGQGQMNEGEPRWSGDPQKGQ